MEELTIPILPIDVQNARTTKEEEYIQNRNFNSIIDRMVITIFRHCHLGRPGKISHQQMLNKAH
jgi:hypothetical protein